MLLWDKINKFRSNEAKNALNLEINCQVIFRGEGGNDEAGVKSLNIDILAPHLLAARLVVVVLALLQGGGHFLADSGQHKRLAVTPGLNQNFTQGLDQQLGHLAIHRVNNGNWIG